MSEYEVCKGYNYPCDCCGKSNCPERRQPPSPSRADILMMHGATEEDIYRGPRED